MSLFLSEQIMKISWNFRACIISDYWLTGMAKGRTMGGPACNSNRMSHFKVYFNQVQILGASGTFGTYSSASSEIDYDESSASHEIDVWKK